jgi:hypothetical protein
MVQFDDLVPPASEVKDIRAVEPLNTNEEGKLQHRWL